jgi:hypothetical protein
MQSVQLLVNMLQLKPSGRLLSYQQASGYSIWVLVLLIALMLSACATRPFQALPVESASFIERAISQTQEPVQITAAVPGADEMEALAGLDLYSQGIQPVWLRIENSGSERVRVALWSIDDGYFSPLEVAWKNRGGYSKSEQVEMERWFLENQMPRFIPPGESRHGFVFTHLRRGTKGFNVDVYASNKSYNFTFFVPVPGFKADYTDIDLDNMYSEDEIQSFDLDGLRLALEAQPCCSNNVTGSEGDPFNVVLVGTALAVRRALLRGGWEETEYNSPDTILAREHRYQNRAPDATFRNARPDGSESKELRLWLAPIRLNEEPVWMGQVSYDMGGGSILKAANSYRIDPDIDDARMFIMQNFWYSQSLAQMAFVGGIPLSTIGTLQRNFNDAEYFTDGLRVVLFVSESPVALDETVILLWSQLIRE